MGIRSSTSGDPYAASDRKTFKSAVCHLLHIEFPGVFGPTISRLFADRIDELYERFHPARSRFRAGQVLWTGVAIDDPPRRNKRIEDTELVPVILDLVAAEDIEQAQAQESRLKTRRAKIARLFNQAQAQKAVLGNADIALLLNLSMPTVSASVLKHERESGKTLPRRGTVHQHGVIGAESRNGDPSGRAGVSLCIHPHRERLARGAHVVAGEHDLAGSHREIPFDVCEIARVRDDMICLSRDGIGRKAKDVVRQRRRGPGATGCQGGQASGKSWCGRGPQRRGGRVRRRRGPLSRRGVRAHR